MDQQDLEQEEVYGYSLKMDFTVWHCNLTVHVFVCVCVFAEIRWAGGC